MTRAWEVSGWSDLAVVGVSAVFLQDYELSVAFHQALLDTPDQ
jgi:hypothetical protein